MDIISDTKDAVMGMISAAFQIASSWLVRTTFICEHGNVFNFCTWATGWASGLVYPEIIGTPDPIILLTGLKK